MHRTGRDLLICASGIMEKEVLELVVAAVPEMLLTQSIILLYSNAVDVANALHNGWSSNSA